jgi:hypothetical protein
MVNLESIVPPILYYPFLYLIYILLGYGIGVFVFATFLNLPIRAGFGNSTRGGNIENSPIKATITGKYAKLLSALSLLLLVYASFYYTK